MWSFDAPDQREDVRPSSNSIKRMIPVVLNLGIRPTCSPLASVGGLMHVSPVGCQRATCSAHYTTNGKPDFFRQASLARIRRVFSTALRSPLGLAIAWCFRQSVLYSAVCRDAEIRDVGILPMRTVSWISASPTMLFCACLCFQHRQLLNTHGNLKLSETFCGILYRANCISLYVLQIKHALPPLCFLSALPAVYGMMVSRMRLKTEHQAGRTRGGLCRGRGSGNRPVAPTGTCGLSHAQSGSSSWTTRRWRPSRTNSSTAGLATDEQGTILVWIGPRRPGSF